MSGDGENKQPDSAGHSRGEASADRVTMAEAAQLKGVSYHTVSRAVRRGKLPVLRLGRMALISMSDLQAWQPMKERAPRKYRRTQRATHASSDPLHLMDLDRLELVRRLATFYELIGTIAVEGSIHDLAEVVTARFAEALHLQRATLWQFDLDEKTARRLGVFNEALFELPDEVPLDRVRVLEDIAELPGTRVLEAHESGFADLVRRHPATGPVMVAPMVRGDKVIGVILGDWKGHPHGEIREEMLQLADVIATQVAIALDNVMRRDEETRRRKMLEAMVDDLNGAVSAFDHHGRLTYVNAAELQMFDLKEGDTWRGQPMHDFVSRKRRLTLSGQPISVDDNPIVRALRGERLQDLRQIAVKQDGERRWVLTSSRPVFVNGELAGAVSVTRDITHERESDSHDKRYLEQLEHALRRSQAVADIVVEINETRTSLDVDVITRFAIDRIVAEFGADNGLLWILGGDHRFHLAATTNIEANGLADEAYSPQQFALANGALMRNKPVLLDANSFSDPEMSTRVRDGLSHVLVIPMRIRGQRTGVAYLGFRQQPVLDESDEIFASVWGRQCAQAIDTALLFQQVESAHSRLVGVIDQLPQAVVIVDADTRLVSVANQAAQSLWGGSVDDGSDVLNLPVMNTEGERLEGANHPLLRPIWTGQQIVSEPLLIPQADGSQVEVLANHAPIFDTRRTIVGSVSVLQNRADFKTLDRAKDEFISVVAHELRNPLTSLRGNMQLLQRRLRKREGIEAEEERQRVGTAIQQVDRIADLVSRMLDVSRVDLGSLDVSPAATDAASLLREVVVSALALEPNREFKVDAPESLPVVWDAARIHQVLSNLMQNAARHAPGTLVEISMEETPDDRVRIAVRDHGPGVPLAIRRRLFKQYYRFDDGKDDESRQVAHDGSRGLGIGLYISARLVKAHHGMMRVDNAPDGGAIFTIDLPRDAGPAEG